MTSCFTLHAALCFGCLSIDLRLVYIAQHQLDSITSRFGHCRCSTSTQMLLPLLPLMLLLYSLHDTTATAAAVALTNATAGATTPCTAYNKLRGMQLHGMH
jgi:hypothetical protein